MFKLIIRNSYGEEIQISVTKHMVERIIDLMYPSKGLVGISKTYIELVNFVNKRS